MKTNTTATLRMDLVCRTCLNKSNNMKPIFTDNGVCIDKMLQFCFDLNMHPEDGFPSNICSDCVHKVYISYKFRRQCELSYNTLVNLIGTPTNTVELDYETSHESTTDPNVQLVNDSELYQCSLCPNQYAKQSRLHEHLMSDHPVDSNETVKPNTTICITNNNVYEVQQESSYLSETDLIMDCIEEKYHVPDINLTVINTTENHYNGNDYHQFHNECEAEFDNEQYINNSEIPNPIINDGLLVKRGSNSLEDSDNRIFNSRTNTNPVKKNIRESNNSLVCNLCNLTFKKKSKYFQHLKNQHSEWSFKSLKKKKVRQNRPTELFECDKCDKVFRQNISLINHQEKKHSDWGIKYSLVNNFLTSRHHTIHKNAEGRKYVCTICGKSYDYVFELKLHVRRHTGERLKCDICGDSFFHLKQHKRNKHGQKPRHKCDICGDSFLYLAKHKRNLHQDKKKLQCNICGNNFLCLSQHKRKAHGIDEKAVKKFITWFIAKVKILNN